MNEMNAFILNNYKPFIFLCRIQLLMVINSYSKFKKYKDAAIIITKMDQKSFLFSQRSTQVYKLNVLFAKFLFSYFLCDKIRYFSINICKIFVVKFFSNYLHIVVKFLTNFSLGPPWHQTVVVIITATAQSGWRRNRSSWNILSLKGQILLKYTIFKGTDPPEINYF